MIYLKDGPEDAARSLVLAHGAGAPMDSDWMNAMARALCDRDIRTIRFEFPYMAQRRVDGKKRPPNTQKILLAVWRDVISDLGADTLVIGGKSMGGRMASMVADEMSVRGVVCLGYPFHPPGKPEKLRTEHLETLHTPTLICQGERDTFGTANEVPSYPLSKNITLTWLTDGDHGFKPRKASGLTEAENIATAADTIAGFVSNL